MEACFTVNYNYGIIVMIISWTCNNSKFNERIRPSEHGCQNMKKYIRNWIRNSLIKKNGKMTETIEALY